MTERVVISGAFDDPKVRLPFFEQIASALERDGLKVCRFNSFGWADHRSVIGKLAERLATVPGRLVGISKQRIRTLLPWTSEGARANALVKAVQEFHPDTLVVISGYRYRAETLGRCRRLGVRTQVGWWIEGPTDPASPEDESKLYDRYYCIHSEIAPAFEQKIRLLPAYALDRENFYRMRFPRTPERRIVFVGGISDRRLRFFDALRSLPLELWGPGWSSVPSLAPLHRGDAIWGAPLNELYNDAAIVLNMASWENHHVCMTQRIAEIPASGAFMLTDATPRGSEIFAPGVEMDTFATPLELAAKCRHYLDHATEREAIADRGYQRAQRLADFAATARVLVGR